MTAPNGAILFNNSTGSDTTASGLGAANVYGSGASTTGSSAVVTGIDTTGVSSGDLLWVQSSSGRQFSIIFTVDSSTQVTCDDTFDNTESGRTWAIGGKRATFDNADSRTAFTDLTSVIIETETDQTINSSIFLGQSLGNLVKGSDGTQVITGTHNSTHFFGKNISIADLTFETSNSTNTGTAAYQSHNGNNVMSAKNLTIDGLAYGGVSNASNCQHRWYGCKATNITNYAIQRAGGNMSAEMTRCYVDTASGAMNWGSGTNIGGKLHNSIISNCSNDVLSASNWTGTLIVYGNIFARGNSDCIAVSATNAVVDPQIAYNIFASNSGYAFNSNIDPSKAAGIYSNVYYSNSSGNTSTGSVESDAITLTADPFVDAAAGDFNLNADAGGGATLRANNYALNTDTSVYPFRQYVSDDFDSGAGGGGSTLHPLYAN